jgi:hypothetical protein
MQRTVIESEEVTQQSNIEEAYRVDLSEVAPLFTNLPKPQKDSRPRCMDSYDQPHGRMATVAGLRYLPRQDLPNGHIRAFRVFLSTKPFPGL